MKKYINIVVHLKYTQFLFVKYLLKSLIKPKIQNYNNKESTFYSTVYTNGPAIIYD